MNRPVAEAATTRISRIEEKTKARLRREVEGIWVSGPKLRVVEHGHRQCPSVQRRGVAPGSRFFPASASGGGYCNAGLLRLLDGELAEREPDVQPASGSVQGERDLSLGQGLRVGRLAGPGVRLRLGVRSEQLVDAPGPGEASRASDDLRFAERDAAPLRLDPDPGRLTGVAGDRAVPLGGLVERGPSLQVERHPAGDQLLVAGQNA